jgi:hypothetical protein
MSRTKQFADSNYSTFWLSTVQDDDHDWVTLVAPQLVPADEFRYQLSEALAWVLVQAIYKNSQHLDQPICVPRWDTIRACVCRRGLSSRSAVGVAVARRISRFADHANRRAVQ